jgi:hypothetical protein
VHAIAPPLQRSRTTNRDGQGEPARETSANDDAALRHELINVLATLCLAGLAGVILQDSERGAAHTRVSIVSPTSR